ncbi:MFS general substrate transporter [Violaceomyces palustris]|uniref:MFS general substrate transporter n=1 Tax=Violaceomyces palustris TaxID=1673888 RepID=A0ACD0NYI3_9BASI|nr:MFS general substrate transporter [Violaceomyces palustris]
MRDDIESHQAATDEKVSQISGPPAGGLSKEATSTLDAILYPEDSYTSDKKTAFVNRQSNAEAIRELKVIGGMFKKDPLSPISAYFSKYVITGLGLFVEGFTLFSVGNLTPLFKAVWPECWKNYEVCDEHWIHAVDYLEIVGIIVGQILVGIEGDWIGRRFGMVQDALIMTLGSIMLTAMWGTTLNGWVICYAWSLFVYGVGVGGEYPMTSTRAMEGTGSGRAASTGDRMHRGRNVALAFLMQGWGQLFNQGILLVGLLAFHGSLNPPYSKTSTQWTFRVQFGVISFVTLYLAYIRYYKMKYSDEALRQAKQRLHTSGYDLKSLNLAGGHYWHRIVGTAGAWFCNDFFFYGNKIFSGVFISIITGGSSSLGTTWLYNLINVGVSLCGYYLAAILMDHKQYGRKWMQINGFTADFLLFIVAAAMYDTLTVPGSGIRGFQAIYFLSGFFNQFGPNSTTFLLAAEVYPASIRATAHGVSAAVGKLGALAPAILYNYIDNKTKFWVVCWFGLAGLILTFLFVPDTTGLDLREQERYWEYVMEGRQHEYHGVAIHPRHLSFWERVVCKRHLNYDAELDRQQKIQELRAVYESTSGGEEKDLTDDQRDFLSNELGGFFAAEKKLSPEGGANSEGGGANAPHPSKLAELEREL